MQMNMDFLGAIIILVEFFIFLPINLLYAKRGKNIPKNNIPNIKNYTKIVLLVANNIFKYILWLLAPILIIFDLYDSFLIWSTFRIFIQDFNILVIQMIGLIIFSLGLILIISARLKLKKYHNFTWEKSKKLDDFSKSGIYSIIRHPIYTAVFLFLIGYIICFQSWLAILCFLISLLLIKVATIEEKRLIKQFGEKYKDYMKKTGKFFPKL
ncbi:MAG: DUF1295 domain-containing protein [Candidatus Lokiarchaeota archaeon]|nr:DUF1295 domain-containing protein [Candidatus Lokiarchaeota archaeon]